MSFSSCGGSPHETPQSMLLESMCSRPDHAGEPHDCYILRVGTWHWHRYSRYPSIIDREQGGLKRFLPMMKAGREPVLRHEIDEFILQKGLTTVSYGMGPRLSIRVH